MVFQSTVRPFPIQPLADSARDLGDTEGGVIAGRLTHQGDIFGGKTASGKADDGEIVHETSEKQGLRTVGYQIQHDRNRRPEQLRDPIEGVFALLTACGQNADQNLLGLRAIFGPIAAPGFSGHHRWTQRPFGGIIGRLDAWTMQKREKPRLFMTQVFGQPPIGGIAKRLGQ